MDRSTSLLPLLFWNSKHLACVPVLGEEDPAFFEELAHRGIPVPGCVFVVLWVLRRWTCPVLEGEVSSREDVS